MAGPARPYSTRQLPVNDEQRRKLAGLLRLTSRMLRRSLRHLLGHSLGHPAQQSILSIFNRDPS